MNRIFSTYYYSHVARVWLLLLRVLATSFTLAHGIPKLQKLLAGGGLQISDPQSFYLAFVLIFIVFTEAICSVLLFLGLITRIASAMFIITTGITALLAQDNDPFANTELTFLYIFIYMTLVVFGPGRYSLDIMLGGEKGKKRRKKKTTNA